MSQQMGLFDVPAKLVAPPVNLPSVKTGGRPEIAYRHPGQLGMAWTGRGKPPRWVTEWIEGGKSLEEIRVPGARL